MITLIINIHGAIYSCSRYDLPKPFARRMLGSLYSSDLHLIFIDEKFDATYASAGSFGHSPTASQNIYSRIIHERGLSPYDTVILEHSYTGARMAADSGAICIVYTDAENNGCSFPFAGYIIEGYDEVDADFFVTAHHRINMLPVTIGTTGRLIIRELSMSDIPDIYRIYSQTHAKRFLCPEDACLEEALDRHRAYIKYQYGFYGYGYWGIFLRESNLLIGSCGVETKTYPKGEVKPAIHVCCQESASEITDNELTINEIGYVIDEAFLNCGYATEAAVFTAEYAFNHLQLGSLAAVIDKTNYASLRVIEKVNKVFPKGQQIVPLEI